MPTLCVGCGGPGATRTGSGPQTAVHGREDPGGVAQLRDFRHPVGCNMIKATSNPKPWNLLQLRIAIIFNWVIA